MYIIKKHYEATESNTNFTGEIKDYYYGRDEELLSVDEFPSDYMILTYGYKALSGAKRGLNKHQELAASEAAYGHWNVNASLVEV